MKNRKKLFIIVGCFGLLLTACGTNNPSGGTPADKSYTVTWKNYDGTVLETDTEVKEGTMPHYDGATPTKPDDADYTYTFADWNPALAAVVADATYTATFTSTPKGGTQETYTITWKNWNGTVLETDTNVPKGTTPHYDGATPTKPEDNDYTYTWSGWNPTVVAATADATYTATFTSTAKSTIPDYVLHGLFHGNNQWTDKQMTVNPSSSTEYMIQGVQLYMNDIFKIHMSGNTWYGYSAIKSSVSSGLVMRGESDDNIVVLTTGIYDIYSNYTESDGGHIYLAKTDSTVNVTGISLNRTGKFMVVRNEFQLEATVYPSNATNKEVTWSSSDTSIATVTSSGRVVAGSTRGSTTITAKTVDGNKTAECLIYVSTSEIPEYYLTGTINGRSYSTGTYTYPAIPLSTNNYLIPDVELVSGDQLTITAKSGAKLKNKYNQTYTVEITKQMSVNIYLNPTDENYNYLTLVEK